MLLDLKEKRWNKIGDLNPYLREKIQQIKPITMSPWGQLVLIGEKINLLDFKSNKILSLNINHPNYQTIVRTHWLRVFYFSDSTLIFANKNKIDSLKFKYSDFKSTNEPLFTKASSDGFNFFTFQNVSYLFISVSILLLSYIYFLRKRINLKNGHEKFVLKSTLEPKTLFDELEIQLLELLIKNTESGKTTTTDEQNKVLGLSKKNSEIQKKQRSDIILSINKKIAFITKNEEPIIQKRRTDFGQVSSGKSAVAVMLALKTMRWLNANLKAINKNVAIANTFFKQSHNLKDDINFNLVFSLQGPCIVDKNTNTVLVKWNNFYKTSINNC